MLPEIDHPVWAEIVTGKKRFQSNRPTFNLLLQSNKMNYERDPSPENLQALIARTYSFLSQYQALFAGEIASILE
jgi:hypothetical protein